MAARVYPVGAEMVSATDAHVRVWAPDARVADAGRSTAAPSRSTPRPAATTPARSSRDPARDTASASTATTKIYPDPASRSQPDGPDGLSAIVDLGAHAWQDAAWPGVSLPGQVLYELHIGTFTPEGTWRAAEAHLAAPARASASR